MAMSCGGSADTPTAVACAKASLKLLEVLPGLTLEELFRRGFEGIDGANMKAPHCFLWPAC